MRTPVESLTFIQENRRKRNAKPLSFFELSETLSNLGMPNSRVYINKLTREGVVRHISGSHLYELQNLSLL